MTTRRTMTETPGSATPDWLLGADDATSAWDRPLSLRPTQHGSLPAVSDALTQTAQLLRSGAAPHEALALVAAAGGAGGLHRALRAAADLVERGTSLPRALATTRALPDGAQEHVNIATLTGDLPGALEAAARDVRDSHDRAQAHRWALLAPAITGATMAGLLFVLFTVLTPALLAAAPGGALPWYATVLLWAGRVLPVPAAAALLLATATSPRSPLHHHRGLRTLATRAIPGGQAAQALAQESTWATVAADVLRHGGTIDEAARAAAGVTDATHTTSVWVDAHRSTPARTTQMLAAHLPAGCSPALRSVAIVAQRTGQLPQTLSSHASTARDDSLARSQGASTLALPAAVVACAAMTALFTAGVLLPVVQLLR